MAEEVRFNLVYLPYPSLRLSNDEIDAVNLDDHPHAKKFAEMKVDDHLFRRTLFGAMGLKERILAEKAFCAALGQADPKPNSPHNDLIRELRDDYMLFGLAPGHNAADELLRKLEADAVSLAKRQQGQNR